MTNTTEHVIDGIKDAELTVDETFLHMITVFDAMNADNRVEAFDYALNWWSVKKQAITHQLKLARIDQTKFIRDEWNKWLTLPDDDPKQITQIQNIVDHCNLLIAELEANETT